MDRVVRKQRAELFSALGSEIRLRIVEMISDDEVQCADILEELELSQPAVSYHLGKLERAGVLDKERHGSRNCYRLTSHACSIFSALKED